MRILGIYDNHNSSLAYFNNNKIEFAINEERITKKKNQSGFPINSLEYFFQKYKINPKNIDYVAICGTDKSDLNDTLYLWSNFFTITEQKNLMKEYWSKKLNGKKYNKNFVKEIFLKKYKNEQNFYYHYLQNNKIKSNNPKYIIKELIIHFFKNKYGIKKNKIKFIDHHTCHIFHSYYSNPQIKYNRKYIGLTVDGFGDGKNQTIWKIENQRFSEVTKTNTNELGRIYRMVTLYLNMRPLEHEYKIMGMAPYNNSKESDKVYEFFKSITKIKNGLILHNKRPKDLYQHIEYNLCHYRFDAIASGVQKYIEFSLCELFKQIINKYKIKDFLYSGGVAMNSKANLEISKIKKLNSVFVPSAPDDQGTSLGACYVIAHRNKINIKPLDNSYLGDNVSSDNQRIVNALKKYKVVKNPSITKIVKLLKSDKIIGICSGRMEFGARALGNRSIIASPHNMAIIDKLNKSIKNRDFWMPFAGTIPYELSKKFLINNKAINGGFMTFCFQAIGHEIFPAACHPYDKTIRAQILIKKDNEWYYELLMNFYKSTGIPILLNTSLNIHGYPLVMNFNDSLDILKKSKIDYLKYDNLLIKNK